MANSCLFVPALPKHAKVLVQCYPSVKAFRPSLPPNPTRFYPTPLDHSAAYPFHTPVSKLSGNCTNITTAGPSTTRVTCPLPVRSSATTDVPASHCRFCPSLVPTSLLPFNSP